MRNKLELKQEQIEFLTTQPEHGMGYQVVQVKLKDGTVLNNRTVVNSTYLLVEENETFSVKEIEEIIIQKEVKP